MDTQKTRILRTRKREIIDLASFLHRQARTYAPHNDSDILDWVDNAIAQTIAYYTVKPYGTRRKQSRMRRNVRVYSDIRKHSPFYRTHYRPTCTQ